MSENKKYNQFQMTYPYRSKKIYHSASVSNVAKRCYYDFQKFNDIDQGLITITNLKTNKEYSYIINKKKIYRY